jgi:hypothetical protein
VFFEIICKIEVRTNRGPPVSKTSRASLVRDKLVTLGLQPSETRQRKPLRFLNVSVDDGPGD